MVRRVAWRKRARSDIADIRKYIARDSPPAAKKVVAAIEQAADGLVDFPYAFRMIPEFQGPDRRETFVYEYRLMYRVEPDRIVVLRVVHGRRLLSNVPGSFEEPPQEAYSAA
jgi:plasmid stabilization system protein ParE